METASNNYIPINFTYYDPKNSLFKSGRSDHAFYRVFLCCNSENCDAFKRGKCILLNGLCGLHCPYGKCLRTEGPTKAAKSLNKFLGDANEKYRDVKYKLSHLNFTCKINEYVYIDLPHLKNYVNSISAEMISDGHMIRGELFTVDFIKTLIVFRPRALFGSEEIKAYQRDEVPKFIKQLKRYFPDKYVAIVSDMPEVSERIQEINYIDKLALVTTLLPGKVRLSTNLLDWDGEAIKGKGNQMTFWGLTDEDVVITPGEKTYVKVADNETVTDETVFKDE